MLRMVNIIRKQNMMSPVNIITADAEGENNDHGDSF